LGTPPAGPRTASPPARLRSRPGWSSPSRSAPVTPVPAPAPSARPAAGAAPVHSWTCPPLETGSPVQPSRQHVHPQGRAPSIRCRGPPSILDVGAPPVNGPGVEIPSRTLDDLAFGEVLRALAGRCRTDAGRQRAQERPFLDARSEVEAA